MVFLQCSQRATEEGRAICLSEGHTRLFELHRQDSIACRVRLRTRSYARKYHRDGEAEVLRDRVLASWTPPQGRGRAGGPQPRKPVATTNFSELSDREAGGFTLATLVNFCFSSF